jgi:hypothetical protein
MNRFSFETMVDRVVPAGLAIDVPVVPASLSVQVAVVSRPVVIHWMSTRVSEFGLAVPTPTPLPGIEGTDVGGDTFYSYDK